MICACDTGHHGCGHRAEAERYRKALRDLMGYGKMPGCVNCGWISSHQAGCPFLAAERVLEGVSDVPTDQEKA